MTFRTSICLTLLFAFIIMSALQVNALSDGKSTGLDVLQQSNVGMLFEKGLANTSFVINLQDNLPQVLCYEGHVLELSLAAVKLNNYQLLSSNFQTAKSTLTVRNTYGKTLGTLTATATFRLNRNTTRPFSAHGTNNIYNVTSSEYLGPEQADAWCKVIFDGTCTENTSIFHFECTIHCNSAGEVSATWN